MMLRLSGLVDPVTRGWAIVAGGSAARLALGFVASVLIARALGPEAFAVFAVLAAASGVAGAIADFGLSDAGVRRISRAWARDPVEAAVRGRAFFWLRAAGAAAVVLAGCLAAGPLSAAALGVADPFLLALALLGVLATALSGAVSSILQSSRRFGAVTAVMLANSGLTAVLAAALALVGALNLVTAIAVLGIGTSLAALGVGIRLLPAPLSVSPPSPRVLRGEAGWLIRFGSWLWIGTVFAALAAQLDLLLVNRWMDPAVVGYYALAANLAAKAEVANHSLHTVLLPTASALSGARAARPYLRRGLARSALLAAALLPILVLAGPLIELFYGPAFLPTAPILQLLLVVAAFELFATPLLLLAFAFDRPRLIAGAEAARAGALAAAGLWLIPALGPAGAAAARLVSRLVGVLVVVVALGQVISHQPSAIGHTSDAARCSSELTDD